MTRRPTRSGAMDSTCSTFAAVTGMALLAGFACCRPCGAETRAGDPRSGVDGSASFSFAVVATATDGPEGGTRTLLRAVGAGAPRFVVHFNLATASAASCSDAALARRRDLLDDSDKPAVPIASGSEWAECGKAASDAIERLDRVGDVFFGSDESLGRMRMPWLRQSAVARFRRYRENLRWQTGNVLFATVNLPGNNNNYRIGAGRNGEFEERIVADRAWIERTFRLANERRLAGVVLFVDAAPRFDAPLVAPDSRSRERDGYYELKLALREFVPAFAGQVLLVQAHDARGAQAVGGTAANFVDHPLVDAAGKPVANFARLVVSDTIHGGQWLRIEVDPASPHRYGAIVEQTFDDPSGELYGEGGVR